MKRRQFLGALGPVLVAPALVGLTQKSPRPIPGNFVDDGGARGHRLRDRVVSANPRDTRRVRVVVVGGGIAGLSAGWQLRRRQFTDFVILESEKTAGGNSRAGENEITRYPWAAHYVPVPNRNATFVRELFEELDVLRDGVWNERYLCFAPQERLFIHGQWHEGIEPEFALDAKGRSDFSRFDTLISTLRDTGQFAIPMANGAQPDVTLDALSMSAWLEREKLTSPALRWYVDYACRDDFGALAADTSAWAGIHYFASRAREEEEGPLTWPDGNGWVANKLIAKLHGHIVTDDPALRIEREGARWRVMTNQTAYIADAVIFAAPSFLLPYVMPAVLERVPLTYSPWLTANLTLKRRPAERGRGAPLSWDNVIYSSKSLGYVVATHQSLRTHDEGSVWTYYWALAEHSPAEGRRLLLQRSWSDWAELILADLELVHPDIRQCVTRLDIMRMGHAMVRPTVGFLRATSPLKATAKPGFFLANSDVSGISIFEEAQYRGVTAATAALAYLSK